jgi:hypothetical protein
MYAHFDFDLSIDVVHKLNSIYKRYSYLWSCAWRHTLDLIQGGTYEYHINTFKNSFFTGTKLVFSPATGSWFNERSS